MFGLRSLRRKVSRSLKRRGFLGTLRRVLEQPFWAVWEYRPARLRWMIRDREFDRQFGVDTSGAVSLSALDIDDESWEHGHSYEPTDPKYFRDVIRGLPIAYDKFTFIDLGSGKGRALLLAAEFPFRRILGAEISQRLHEIAERNIRNYRNPAVRCVAVESICADASNFRLPDGPVVLYMFNPFQEKIMLRVLSNIRISLLARPREMYVIYRTPLLDALLDRTDFLKRLRAEHGYAVYAALGITDSAAETHDQS
jgi:SAM-dependent methyltransferase